MLTNCVVVRTLLAGMCLSAALAFPSSDVHADPAPMYPSQWIAKISTEAVGRAPTSAGWNWARALFENSGCTTGTLQAYGTAAYKGSAFLSLDYDNASRLLALFRGALNTELSEVAFDFFYDALEDEVISWSYLVDAIFASASFENLAPQICSSTDPDYGFGDVPVGDLKAWAGQGASRTQEALQAQLDAAANTCGTVSLAPREVIFIGGDQPGQADLRLLRIPGCVTLETAGQPTVSEYAAMGRLVPLGGVCSIDTCDHVELVHLGDGASLRSVWVDGREALDANHELALVGAVTGAAPTQITDVRMSDPPAGGAAIRLNGWGGSGTACSNRAVTRSLVTAYARADDQTGLGAPLGTDGIEVHCEDALIEDNWVIDVSGSSISLHGSWNSLVGNQGLEGRRAQQSVVRTNTVISAGINGTVALEADPVGECRAEDVGPLVPCVEFNHVRNDMPGRQPERDFEGAEFDSNEFWTGFDTHFDVGILAGGTARWASNTPMARGLDIRGNSTAGSVAIVQTAILVSGMLDTTIVGNDLSEIDIHNVYDGVWEGGCESGMVVLGHPLANLTPGSDVVVPTLVGVPWGQVTGCLIPTPPSAGREPVVVDDGELVGAISGKPFVPWGHNQGIDHDSPPTEILMLRHLGTNVVRFHPQFRDIMNDGVSDVCEANPIALADLSATAERAEQLGIYLVVTGLGSFDGDLADPGCYSNTTQQERWDLQAEFWSVVAAALQDSPAVLLFDLMNEPVVPVLSSSTPCWAGDPTVNPSTVGCLPELAGKYFAQNITRDPVGDPNEVGTEWLQQMTEAVRSVDADRLITVGCLPTVTCAIGVDPMEMAMYLDVLSVHVYPEDCTEAGHAPSDSCALFGGGIEPPGEILHFEHSLVSQYKATGKPVIVEEIFPLSGDVDLVEQFILGSDSDGTVDGWIGQFGEGAPLSYQRVAPSVHYPDIWIAPYAGYDWGRLFQKLTSDIAPCEGCAS